MKTLFEKMRDNRAARSRMADRAYIGGLEKMFKQTEMNRHIDGKENPYAHDSQRIAETYCMLWPFWY